MKIKKFFVVAALIAAAGAGCATADGSRARVTGFAVSSTHSITISSTSPYEVEMMIEGQPVARLLPGGVYHSPVYWYTDRGITVLARACKKVGEEMKYIGSASRTAYFSRYSGGDVLEFGQWDFREMPEPLPPCPW